VSEWVSEWERERERERESENRFKLKTIFHNFFLSAISIWKYRTIATQLMKINTISSFVRLVLLLIHQNQYHYQWLLSRRELLFRQLSNRLIIIHNGNGISGPKSWTHNPSNRLVFGRKGKKILIISNFNPKINSNNFHKQKTNRKSLITK
jgi:hypothetical protein